MEWEQGGQQVHGRPSANTQQHRWPLPSPAAACASVQLGRQVRRQLPLTSPCKSCTLALPDRFQGLDFEPAAFLADAPAPEGGAPEPGDFLKGDDEPAAEAEESLPESPLEEPAGGLAAEPASNYACLSMALARSHLPARRVALLSGWTSPAVPRLLLTQPCLGLLLCSGGRGIGAGRSATHTGGACGSRGAR